MSTSDKIKALIRAKGIKQVDLAERLDMSKYTLANKLSKGVFSVDDVIRIADALGVELSFTENGKNIISFEKEDAAPPRRSCIKK